MLAAAEHRRRKSFLSEMVANMHKRHQFTPLVIDM